MSVVKKYLWVFLILFVVLIFFYPIFKGQVPFPGDLLTSVNPYNSKGYLGFGAGGYPNKAQGPDVIYEIYPWRYFSINQLKDLSIPFWNPYNFSGNPQMANLQTAIFYPFNFLYFLFSFNNAWTLIVMLQPFLAAVFMYLFLKKAIELSDFPALIGGISFGFSSYMVVWIEYGNIASTLAWLPLILLLVKYLISKKSLVYAIAISLFLSFSILAGYIQGVFYIYAISFFYYLFLAWKTKEKNLKIHFLFFISLLAPIFLTAFQLLPTIQIFLQSTRGAYSLIQTEKNLAPFFTWITIVFPDFFGNPATRNYWIDGTYIERVMYPGTVVLFFAFYAFLSKITLLEKKFFLSVSAVSLIIATNLPFVKYLYLLPIPVISTTVPTRELSIFIFSTIVLGSIGLEHFLKEKKLKLNLVILYIAIFSLLWIFVLFFQHTTSLSENLKVAMHNMILPTFLTGTLIFALVVKNKSKKLTLILVSLILVVDLFYFFQKITPFSPKELIYPSNGVTTFLKENAGINRFWGYGSAYIPSNFQSVDMTFSPEGNDPLHISRYGNLLASSKDGKVPNVVPRPDANIINGYGQEDLKNNFFRKRILDLLGVKFIVNKQELKDAFENPDLSTFPKENYKMVYKSYPFQIYQNLDSLPRVFLTNNYIVSDKSKILSYIYNPNVDLKKTLILENQPSVKLGNESSGVSEVILYKPNEIVIKTTSNSDSLLFLSDNFYSEWEASVDQNPTRVLIADYSFRAVEVPKGQHIVKFIYNPKSFKYGVMVSTATLVFILLLLFYAKKTKKI